LLLLAAAKQTGRLEMLVTAVMEWADLTIPGVNPPNPAVVMRLILTLLFLPVAGLARTWERRELYGDDVGRGDQPGAGLQSALRRTVSRVPGPRRSSRTPDKRSGEVDVAAVANRAAIF
jgi:hypothetical protein